MDDCSILRDYIEFELTGIPEQLFPGVFFFPSSSVYILVVNETVPTFFELLESTPSLFSNLSQAIDDAVDRNTRLSGTISFSNLRAELRGLAAEFVTVANDSCGISLSQEQIANVTRLFDGALPAFLVALVECNLINVTIIEEAVAAIEDSIFGLSALLFEILFRSEVSLLANRISVVVNNAVNSPADDVPAAAQVALDEFL